MSLRADHLDLLRRALEIDDLRKDVRDAFDRMLDRLTTEVPGRCAHGPIWYEQWALTDAQEQWVRRALGEEVPERETRLTDGAIPRGREVPTPEVLKKLPLKPPGRS